MKERQKTEERFFSFLEENEMVNSGDRIVLGISGGADSVCLLFLLLEYRKKKDFDLIAVYVNHGLRGAAAAEDGAFVEELCREREIPFRLAAGDVRALAARERCSEEDAGRRFRYGIFREICREERGTRIAVAHNANDRAETVLLHLFRGSGLRGLRGIEPVQGDIIRPLLCLEREEIEEYLRERGISWRTDETNAEDAYVRNRIRHHILPYAEREISPGAVARLCKTADILSEAEDYFREQTAAARKRCVAGETDGGEKSAGEPDGGEKSAGREEIEVAAFLELHPAIRKRVLLELLEELSPTGKDISAVHVESVFALFEKEGNRSVSLPFGICCSRRYERVVFSRSGEEEGEAALLPELEKSEIIITNRKEVPKKQYTKWFDYDKIKESPTLRFREQGDYLTISDGKGGCRHKSLQDYLVTEKIPRELRDRIPVLAEGNHVIWLVGYRISEYYKVDGNTKRVLQVKLKGSCEDSETEEKDGGAYQSTFIGGRGRQENPGDRRTDQ
ncbi:MAG: tRNA lysidine(34) synthetase TilS [Roseburia sp.]|nr:tRNA lysidine(34) synthetase TilS [Roseburia sp.]MCM1096708.1 tRNA lysidine(34) synthetase TilS [Ruminococcus flavefaciens]